MLYYLYRVSEIMIKQHHPTWVYAYVAFKKIVKESEQKFIIVTTPTWDEIDDGMHVIETEFVQLFNIGNLK